MFDMKNLSKLTQLDENAPDAMKAFWAFDKAVFAAGALDLRRKQLIAVCCRADNAVSILHRASSQGCSQSGSHRPNAG